MKSLLQTVLLGLIAGTAANANSQPAPLVDTRPKVEVAFVLDTTGSMGGLIEGAKQKIWSIANEIASANSSPEVKLGLIGYRDINDDYVTQTYDLSSDLDHIYAKLIEFQAGGGGDGPESVNQALYESVTKLSWSEHKDTLKIIFLVGDAPPHMDYQEDVKYMESCALAGANGLIINTIQCGNQTDTRAVWQAIAQYTEGEYVAIQQSGGMHAITTPMDEAISELNTQMASTVITYGDSQAQTLGKTKVSNAIAADAEAAAARYNYFSATNASTSTAISGNEDLVAQLDQNTLEASDIKHEHLPEDLQALSQTELTTHIAKKSEQRAVIQSKLTALLKERQMYIDAEKKRLTAEGKSDGFDNQVNAMIRTQAATKGITYEE